MTETENPIPENEATQQPDAESQPAPAPVDAAPAPEDTAPAAPDAQPAETPVEETQPTAPEPSPAPRGSHAPPDGHWWWGTGRRKAAVARVRIRPGAGMFIVNKLPHDEFFTGERDRNDLMNILHKTRTHGTVDVFVNVSGGGFTGQAGAIILGLARALKRYDESLEPILRDNNFLTRDPRRVERKKYGQPGARKRFQFSKR